MGRPAWLPPLNSHENYSINVAVHRCYMNFPAPKPSVVQKSIGIMIDVDVKFYSDDINKQIDRLTFYGLTLCHGSKTRPTQKLSDVDLRNHVKELVEDRQLLPFTLDKINSYIEMDELEHELDQSRNNDRPRSQHEVVNRITDFFSRTMTQYYSGERGENLQLVLSIEKVVIIPDREFGAWTSWYGEQKRLDPDGFDGQYWQAISVPRTLHELWYESSLLAFESAAESCIASLEMLSLDEAVGDSQESSCTICLEEFRKGEQVTKLSCSHVFHGDCLIPWLKTSHFCPICRYMLPTS